MRIGGFGACLLLRCAGGGPNNAYSILLTYLPSESALSIKNSIRPTRGLIQDTGLDLPRLGVALAGPWAAAHRLGTGASAGARGGCDDS